MFDGLAQTVIVILQTTLFCRSTRLLVFMLSIILQAFLTLFGVALVLILGILGKASFSAPDAMLRIITLVDLTVLVAMQFLTFLLWFVISNRAQKKTWQENISTFPLFKKNDTHMFDIEENTQKKRTSPYHGWNPSKSQGPLTLDLLRKGKM